MDRIGGMNQMEETSGIVGLSGNDEIGGMNMVNVMKTKRVMNRTNESKTT